MSSTGPAVDRSALALGTLSPTFLKRVAVALTALAVGAGLFLLPSWGGDEIGQMEIRELRGDMILIRDGETLPIDGAVAIEPGDTIKAVDSRSAAELRLSGDRHAWLADRAATTIVDDQSMSLESGSVKAQSSNGDRLSLIFDDIEIRPDGNDVLFRIDQGFGFARAAVYSGAVTLNRPGDRPLELDRLFEASIAGGELPLSTKPYRFDDKDEWDRQHLQPVIELDENLMSTAASLTNQLGNRRPGLEFFNGLAGKKVGYVRSFLKRPTQDLLIGFTIGQNAPEDRGRAAMEEAFRLHDSGGRWGTVATILRSQPKRLIAELNDIVLATGIADGDAGQDAPDLTLSAAAGASDGGSGNDDGSSDPGTDPGDGGNDPEDPKDPKDPGDGPGDGEGDCEEGDTGCEVGGLVCSQGLCPSPTPSDGPLEIGILEGGKKSSSSGSGLTGGLLLVPVPLGAWLRRFWLRKTTRA